MNRRGFLATVGAILAAPKAVKLLPAATRTITTPWIPLTGLEGWARVSGVQYFGVDRSLPSSVMGRFEWCAEALKEGWITSAEAADLMEVPTL